MLYFLSTKLYLYLYNKLGDTQHLLLNFIPYSYFNNFNIDRRIQPFLIYYSGHHCRIKFMTSFNPTINKKVNICIFLLENNEQAIVNDITHNIYVRQNVLTNERKFTQF